MGFLYLTTAAGLRSWLCTIVVIIGLVEFVHDRSQLLVYAGGAVAFITFLVNLPVTATYTRVIVFILCLIGLTALYHSGNLSLGLLIVGFIEMTPLVALMAAVSLLGIPLELGRYADLFHGFYARTKGLYQTYLVSLIISYVLSLFSLLGSVAPSYYLVNQNLNRLGLERNSRFEATCIIRGYAMAVIISPVAANVGIAMQYSGLTWLEMVGPVFILSLLGLLAAFVVEPSWRSIRSFDLHEAACSESPDNKGGPCITGKNVKRYVSFISLFAGVIGSIFVLGNGLHFSALNSISAGCFLAVLGWGVFSGQFRTLFMRIASFFRGDITKLTDQIILFIAAGFFTHSMEHSGGLLLLGNFVEGASGSLGPAVVLALVPVVILLLAAVGLHPFASAIIIGKTISVSALYFNPLGLALALVTGISMSFMISPFSVLVLMLSSFTGNSPYKVGFRWNIAFVSVFWGLNTAILALIIKYY